MENIKSKSSILLSIFKRKGGEGLLTKLVTDVNKIDYTIQLGFLEEDENALLVYREDDLNWLLLTDERVIEAISGIKLTIYLSELKAVNLALNEEFKDRVLNKEDFTRLLLKDVKGNSLLVKVEKGKPFQGLYQMLHYISSFHKSPS